NYVTTHDRHTHADLDTFNHKHNHANGEDNRDGTDDNRSWNHGVEGPVTVPPGEPRDPRGGPGDGAAAVGWVPEPHPRGAEILTARRRSARNLLGTLLLSVGTPIITAGHEIGRTQMEIGRASCREKLELHLYTKKEIVTNQP